MEVSRALPSLTENRWKSPPQLDGPRDGRSAGRDHKANGYAIPMNSRCQSTNRRGFFQAFSAMKARAVVVRIGRGVTSVKKVTPTSFPVHAGMPAMHRPALSRKTNLCTAAPFHAGPGPDARRHFAFSIGGKAPSITTWAPSTFAKYTVLPEIAVAKIRETFSRHGSTSDAESPPARRRDQHRQVEQGAKANRVGLGGIGLTVLQGWRLAGADMIIGVDIKNDRKGVGRKLRHDAFRSIEGRSARTSPQPRRLLCRQ